MAEAEYLICPSAVLLEGGEGIRFSYPTEWGSEPAFAVRHGGQVRAYLNRCAHVPVELDWQPGKFFDDSGLYLICSVHGALYAPDTGACLGGRCRGGRLHPVPVEELNGQVYFIPKA